MNVSGAPVSSTPRTWRTSGLRLSHCSQNHVTTTAATSAQMPLVMRPVMGLEIDFAIMAPPTAPKNEAADATMGVSSQPNRRATNRRNLMPLRRGANPTL